MSDSTDLCGGRGVNSRPYRDCGRGEPAPPMPISTFSSRGKRKTPEFFPRLVSRACSVRLLAVDVFSHACFGLDKGGGEARRPRTMAAPTTSREEAKVPGLAVIR